MPLKVTVTMTAEQLVLIQGLLEARSKQLMAFLNARHITPEEEDAYEQELGLISQLIGEDHGDATT